MNTAAIALSNGNARAFVDSLEPSQTYTVTSTSVNGVTATEISVAGQTVIVAHGGDQVDLFMYGSDQEAQNALEWAVGELATAYLRAGALVEVRTPDGRTVNA
jgi:hypothetical protein